MSVSRSNTHRTHPNRTASTMLRTFFTGITRPVMGLTPHVQHVTLWLDVDLELGRRHAYLLVTHLQIDTDR